MLVYSGLLLNLSNPQPTLSMLGLQSVAPDPPSVAGYPAST